MITVDMLDWERLAEELKCEFIAFAWSMGNKETFEEMRKDLADLNDMLKDIEDIENGKYAEVMERFSKIGLTIDYWEEFLK